MFLTAEPAGNIPPAGQPLIPGTAWDFGPDGLVFATPVVMTIAYDPSNVPQGVAQSELRIHKLVNGSYEQQDAGLVDLVNHTVLAEVDGFSVYVIIVRDPLNLEDIEAPVVRAIEVRNVSSPTFGSATTLDVSSGDATLFTRVTLTDNGAGVNWIDLRWMSPAGRQVRFPCYRGGPPNSGSDTNGEWECTAVFPQHTEPGLWRPQVVWIRDNVQNQAIFVEQVIGFCQTTPPANCLTNLPQVTVNSATPDLNPPVLQSFAVSLDVQPRAFSQSVSVDASMGGRRVWFGFQATDDLTGIGGFLPFDYFWVSLRGPGNQILDFIGTCRLTLGTNVNGFWECFVDIPAQAQAGRLEIAVRDAHHEPATLPQQGICAVQDGIGVRQLVERVPDKDGVPRAVGQVHFQQVAVYHFQSAPAHKGHRLRAHVHAGGAPPEPPGRRQEPAHERPDLEDFRACREVRPHAFRLAPVERLLVAGQRLQRFRAVGVVGV